MAHSPTQTASSGGCRPQPLGCTILPGSTTRSNVFSSIQPSDTGFNRKLVEPTMLRDAVCGCQQHLEMARTLSDHLNQQSES